MSRQRFIVTYEVITRESAECGEAEERGVICEGETLREAIRELNCTRTNRVDGVEAVEPSNSHGRARWITVYNGMEFETGAHENRSLHISDSVSDSSARRIARLCGVSL